MDEEERRRCIILGACPAGVTREQAIAEELQAAASARYKSLDTAMAKVLAKHLRKHYRFASAK